MIFEDCLIKALLEFCFKLAIFERPGWISKFSGEMKGITIYIEETCFCLTSLQVVGPQQLLKIALGLLTSKIISNESICLSVITLTFKTTVRCKMSQFLSLLLISFLYLEKYNKLISINHLLSNRKAATNREGNVYNAN